MCSGSQAQASPGEADVTPPAAHAHSFLQALNHMCHDSTLTGSIVSSVPPTMRNRPAAATLPPLPLLLLLPPLPLLLPPFLACCSAASRCCCAAAHSRRGREAYRVIRVATSLAPSIGKSPSKSTCKFGSGFSNSCR